MKQIQLQVQPRNRTGKGGNRQLRSEGKIPAILYGLGQPAQNLKIDSRQFAISTSKLGDDLVFFDLELDGKSNLAVVRELQRDPVTDQIIHIDMFRVDMEKPMDFMLPIHHTGQPKGIAEGGFLEQLQRLLHIRCAPNIVPGQVDLDISDLGVGDSLHVSDITLGDGIEILSTPTEVLLHVILPRIVEEEVPADAEEGVEGEEGAEGSEDGGAEGKSEGE